MLLALSFLHIKINIRGKDMPFQIVHNDICQMQTEAIVNAANSQLKIGGGVCGAIFKAAGIKELQDACYQIGNCGVGEAVITQGYNLKANYIIHTVGPIWKGGSYGEAELLEKAYLNTLKLAKEKGITSIAFPLIATGIYGYPKKQALVIGVNAIKKFLVTEEMAIYLVVYDREAVEISGLLCNSITHYINHYYEEVDRDHRRRFAEEERILHETLFKEEGTFEEASYSKRKLERLLHHMDETFSEMLLRLIDEKGKTDVEVYKKANIDRKLFSKIRGNKAYVPKKTTALALAIGLELSLDETKDLLMKAGYALTMSQKSDVIVRYFIENRQYDLFEINQTLFYFQQALLGSI